MENSGLGGGDEVWLENNNLDLWEGSEDLENIRALEARGGSSSLLMLVFILPVLRSRLFPGFCQTFTRSFPVYFHVQVVLD